MEFSSLKYILAKRCLSVNACKDKYSSFLSSETQDDIIEHVKTNFFFINRNGIIAKDEWKMFFDESVMNLHHLYSTGEHSVYDGSKRYFVGDSIGHLYNGSIGVFSDNSIAHVYDNSLAECIGNARAVKHGGKSRIVAP